jgi:hypothetical protein
MSAKNTQSQESAFVTQEEAAAILGLENPTSVSHIEGDNGFCMKAVPKVYRRSDAVTIRAQRDAKAAAKEQAQAEKESQKEAERHEPAKETKTEEPVAV